MTLLADLRGMIHQLGDNRTYWIGYSGGLDSCVLLSLCHNIFIEQALSFRVIHVNHGLSVNADKWAAHCADVCNNISFSFETISIQIDPSSGESLEALAREKRYAVFAEKMQAGDVLLTAHHRDDQTETVLLQLLRGSGLKGLSAMPAVKLFAAGYHARPLLNSSRDEMEAYAKLKKLSWIEDESNDNPVFLRNYLRHEVMPAIKRRFPSAANTISRTASHCAEAQQLLEDFGLSLMESVKGSAAGTLSVSALSELPDLQQKLVLRIWIASTGFPLPDAKKLGTILNDMLTAAWDRFPCVEWGEVELRRHRDNLYLLHPLPPHDTQQSFLWDLSAPLNLSGIGEFYAHQIVGASLLEIVRQVEIRFRQGGEMIELPARGRQSLKNLFNEWNIVPWVRDRVPLIYVEGELVGVLLS